MANNADLLEAINASDTQRASALVQQMLRAGMDPWEIHLALYPAVQPVLNPPFINPHLPKMYAVLLVATGVFFLFFAENRLPAGSAARTLGQRLQPLRTTKV